jgi:hypothetical protein
MTKTWQFETHSLELLRQAAVCLDRIAGAEAALTRDGLTVLDRFGQVRSHPATVIERDQKALFKAIVRELALSDEPAPDGPRPPGLKNRYQFRD